jgi:hypothetical protein
VFKHFCDKCLSQIGLSYRLSYRAGEGMTCIWEMSRSILGRVTDYPEIFPLAVQANAGIVPGSKPRHLLPFFPTYHTC